MVKFKKMFTESTPVGTKKSPLASGVTVKFVIPVDDPGFEANALADGAATTEIPVAKMTAVRTEVILLSMAKLLGLRAPTCTRNFERNFGKG